MYKTSIVSYLYDYNLQDKLMDQSSTKEQKYLMDHIKLEFMIRIIGGGGCGAESVSHAKKNKLCEFNLLFHWKLQLSWSL